MYSIVSNCPKCGAPIYVVSPWWGLTPPPTTYSCECFLQVNVSTSDSTTIKIKKE
jgi:hypothetical protein